MIVISTYTLPDVYVQENDFSQIIREANAARLGLVVDSDEGPVGDTSSDTGLIQITTPDEYVREFGIPQTDMEQAAITALRASDVQGINPYVLIRRALPGEGSQSIDAYWGGLEWDDVGASFNDPGQTTYPIENYSFPSTDETFAIFANQPADSNSNIGIQMIHDAGESDEFQIDVYTRPDSTSDWEIQEEFLVALTEKKDARNRQMYIEDRINKNSEYVIAIHNDGQTSVPSQSVTTTQSLQSGSSGSSIVEGDLVEAAQAFRNPQDADVRMLISGGFVSESSLNFANELADIAASRKDMVALIDGSLGTDVSTLTDGSSGYAANITVPSSPSNAGSYMAFYHPWVNDYEPERDKTITQPPTGYVAKKALVSFTENDPWFAIAGPRRGRVAVDSLNQTFNETDQQTLYENNFNPIRDDNQFGPTIWGQKTYRLVDSALDRLNVRMLLITIEIAISRFARSSLFEFNDPYTRDELRNGIISYLETVQGRRGLEQFSVKIDEENNDASVRNQNMLVGDINLIPTKVAEVIVLNFNIFESGASEFEETTVAV